MQHSRDENKEVISDICSYGNSLLVSTYQSNLKLYSENVLKLGLQLPFSITKLCLFKDKVLGISYTQGILLVLDSQFRIIDAIMGFERATIIISSDNKVIIATANKDLVVLSEVLDFEPIDTQEVHELLSSNHLFKIVIKKQIENLPTALACDKGQIALCSENKLFKLDLDLNELFYKEYTCCINTAMFFGNGIALGLINGKIHFEALEDTFAFNAHVLSKDAIQTLFPVTQLSCTETLVSSGYDGRVISWDMHKKKLVKTLLEVKSAIRKTVIVQNGLYCLLEEDPVLLSGNSLLYTPVN
ncbi:hypothetical protein GINT2_000153 [Glugoides intestinalis]